MNNKILETTQPRRCIQQLHDNIQEFIRFNPPANENDVMMLSILQKFNHQLFIKLATLKRDTIKITTDIGTYAALRIYHIRMNGQRFSDADFISALDKQIIRTDYHFHKNINQLKTA